MRWRELDTFKILEIFWIFLGIFLGGFFWRNLFGGIFREIFLEDFFWRNSLRIFFGNFLGIFCELFRRNFLGGFFGRNFLGGFFWEDIFGRMFWWGIFWEDSTKSYLNIEGIDLFVKILVLSRFCLKEEEEFLSFLNSGSKVRRYLMEKVIM